MDNISYLLFTFKLSLAIFLHLTFSPQPQTEQFAVGRVRRKPHLGVFSELRMRKGVKTLF